MSEHEEQQAIGTLCIVDDKPRAEFSEEERRKLQRLGELARKEVAAWHQLRMQEKTRLMRKQLATLHTKAEAARKPASQLPVLPERKPSKSLPDIIALPASERTSAVGKDLTYWEIDDSDTDEDNSPLDDSDRLSMEECVISNSKQITSTFNLATRMIAKTLALPLVYLIALNLTETGEVNAMDLMSSYGLPNPTPVFDKSLHLKALKAPEGGLLYQVSCNSSPNSSIR